MSGRNRLRNGLAMLSIILIGSGIAMLVVRRARSMEFGIVLLLLGIVLFYIRYFSEMMRDEPKIKIIDAEYKRK